MEEFKLTNKQRISIAFSMIVLIALSISVISYTKESHINSGEELKELTPDCTNLTVKDTANCYHKYIKEIYNYQVRPDTPKPISDLILNGGDCYDWNVLYKDLALNDGFKARSIIIGVDNETAHTFTIMYDESGYCKLDQISEPVCFIYGET